MDAAAATARAFDALSRPRMVALDSLALIEVGGEDAREFLQAQLGGDVGAAQPERAQLNAYCNPKGRVIAALRLIPRAEGFWLVAPAELADKLILRLKMFVLRAKVEIARSQSPLFGAINCNGEDGISHAELDGDTAVSRKFLLGAPAEKPAEKTDAFWRLADILAGLPQVYAPTAEQFLPQAINLDLTGGVSFTKGCFPGQEIVARLRHRGKVKQRMFALFLPDAPPPAPGAPLLAEDSEQKIGQVVDAVACDGGSIAGAVLPATAPDGAKNSARIKLPYEIPETAEAA
ncbi:MAG: hypothetical protein MPK09_05845 [Gammaproteobacteria bacterium]|nr:hypothetical protein [Gammaproteobacteria bacterium]